MTPEQEFKTVWPKAQTGTWPFPTYRPEEGANTAVAEKPPVPAITAIKTTSTDQLLAGANGTSYTTLLPPGGNGAELTMPIPEGWGSVTISNAKLSTPYDATVAVLDERAKNYGTFTDMAAITQKLKEILHTAPSWKTMKADQQESLEMIVHKIARILNGRPDYADSWVDIAGYARLVGDRLEKGIVR